MWITIIFIMLGTLLLVNSGSSIYRIITLVGKERKSQNYWRVLFFLTFFFVFAYLGAASLIATEMLSHLIYLVGFVFFFGALFVYVSTRIGLSTIKDITHEVRVRTQELRIARKVADNANSAKSHFLAVMSHEIRTPLTSIIATLDILREITAPPPQEKYLEILKRASNNLLNQINDILDFSKIESGHLSLEDKPMCLNDSVENVLNIMRIRCQEKNIDLITDIQIDTPLHIISDPIRLEQVMINIIGNSIKFTLKGHIQLKIQQISSSETHSKIKFCISDTGIGIAKDSISSVFKSFIQADTTITRRFGGSGLGLTICQNIVKEMGGEINVESKLGKGTLFHFTLEFNRTKDYAEIKKTNKSIKLDLKETMKMLLVEDNEDNRFLIRTFLKNPYIELDLAENGQIALDHVFANDYDLVLMDIQMPVMDGFTAMKRIRAWEKENNRPTLPILSLTASSTKEDVMHSYECGCTEYLTKPIRKRTLIEAVSRYAKLKQEAKKVA